MCRLNRRAQDSEESVTRALHESFDNKADAAYRKLREGRRIRGAAAMGRPLQSLLRASWPARSLGGREEKSHHPKTETLSHG